MNAMVTPSDVKQFRELIVRQFGLQFDDGKLGWLAEVLQRRCGHRPCGRYLAQLAGAGADGEFAALAPELTVAETYFFRHVDQFHALRERVVSMQPELLAGKRRLQILSAGCASGEEAYSIAMMLWDVVGDPSGQLCIHAVDLNPVMIGKARLARYTPWALRETPQPMRERWFSQEGSEWVLDDRVRAAVTFEVRNLCEDNAALWLPQRYDFVFCRNVLMYFEPLRAQAVVGRITHSLVQGGCLFLGHAETLRGLSEAYQLRHVHRSFHYERKKGVFDTGAADVAPSMARTSHAGSAHAPAMDGVNNWVETIGKAAERVGVLSAKAEAAPVGVAPRNDRRWLDRAFSFFERERFAEALELVESFPEAAGRNPEAMLLHAVLLVHVGRLAPAEEVCHRLLAIDELNAGAHYVLALCREGVGDCGGAAERDQLAARLDPGFAMPRLHLGLLARRAGNREAQRREFAQAKALLEREDASRLMLFGGGFGRDALLGLCRAELAACGAPA